MKDAFLWREKKEMGCLLAVDMGIKTGLALYGEDGCLLWYRSRNFGLPVRLRRGVRAVLNDIDSLSWIILEGGGPICDIWEREAGRRHISFRKISAETWRERFLLPRERRSGTMAKFNAEKIARRVIKWSGLPLPKVLGHDAAEAILIGLWGVVQIGLLDGIPSDIKQRGLL